MFFLMLFCSQRGEGCSQRALRRGVCEQGDVDRGVWMRGVWTGMSLPSPTPLPMETDAVGKQPTGMHSCFLMYFNTTSRDMDLLFRYKCYVLGMYLYMCLNSSSGASLFP